MKFIIVCLTVCVIALNLSFTCANNPERLPRAVEDGSGQNFTIGTFKNALHNQCNTLIQRINGTWDSCRKTYPVEGHQSRMDMFSNAPTNEVESIVSNDRRCLVGCTLSAMGVMTNDGLDVAEYMAQIRQLRLNYTSFDINEKSTQMKEKIFSVTRSQLPSLVRKDNCYYISQLNPKRKYSECYDLIESYAQAARECKDLQDPDGDICETSWMVMSCMIQSHRKRSFESPFYPIFPETGKIHEQLWFVNR